MGPLAQPARAPLFDSGGSLFESGAAFHLCITIAIIQPMDWVLKDLLSVERRLQEELHTIRRLIRRRRERIRPMIPSDRLLCEIVHEAYELMVWENEGGALDGR